MALISVCHIQGPAEVRPAWVWLVGYDNLGVIIYSFNLNISLKISYGVIECDIVRLQNYMVMIL